MLDTSAAIAVRDVQPEVMARFEALSEQPLLSILSVVELAGGVAKSEIGRDQRRRAVREMLGTLDVLRFDIEEAEAYRIIVETLGFSRRKILDRMIAAQAIVAEAVLATLNPRDFTDIPGLQLEDWSATAP